MAATLCAPLCAAVQPSRRNSIWCRTRATLVAYARIPAQQLEPQTSQQHIADTARTEFHEPATETRAPQRRFEWTQTWYPALVVGDLETDKPHAITILGRDLVIWRDSQQQWRCFEDACPHRLAPLSEGRIEPTTGLLMCSYHAWQFDGEGRCKVIPHLEEGRPTERACNHVKSAVQTYPTQAAGGLLWVWLDTAPTAFVDAFAVPLPLAEHLMPHMEKRPAFMRDLPYGHMISLENLVDPSHLPVSHHGISKDFTRDVAKPTPMELQKYSPGAPNATISFRTVWPNKPRNSPYDTNLTFVAPCHVWYQQKVPTATINTVLFAVPVLPGRSRTFVSFVVEPKSQPAQTLKGRFQSFLTKKLMPIMMPRWKLHHLHNTIFDGDGVFLNKQEYILKQKHDGTWQGKYFMPASVDKMVATVRKWADQYAAGGPQWPADVPDDLPTLVYDKKVLLNRYDQHTKHCSACQERLAFLERLRVVGAVVAAATFLAYAAYLGSGHAFVSGGTAVAGFAALASIAAILSANKQLAAFFYLGYDHSER